jgi:acyl-CoA dehydrogenase
MIRDRNTLDAFLARLRRFVDERCIPNEALVEDSDAIPAAIVNEMRELGLFGYTIPEQYGGLGFTSEEMVLAAFEMSRCTPAFRARCGTNTGIGSEALVQDGTEEQKARYLPRLASGEITGSFALTEPEFGSDATSLATSARRDGGHYIINGSKCFITNAPLAGIFTVMARTDPQNRGAGGVSAFIVEAGTPGLLTAAPYLKMGQAGSPVSEVHFNECRVPAANIIGGKPGMGFKTAMRVLNKQRLHLAALCVGPALRLLEEMLRHAVIRQQFGKPIGEFQLVQAMIADSHAEIEAARAMVLDAATQRDAGMDIALEASMCKYYASEMVGRVADRAVQVFGGAGYTAAAGIERFYRDVRAFRLYEGTSQIHQLNIAKLMLRNLGDAENHA